MSATTQNQNSPRDRLIIDLLVTDSDKNITRNSKNSKISRNNSTINTCNSKVLPNSIKLNIRTLIKMLTLKFRDINQSIKEKMLRGLLEASDYNNLILGWLYLNIPITESVCTFEKFAEQIKFSNVNLNESEIEYFFKNASTIWKNIDDPTLINIRDSCLNIVAISIAEENKDLAASMIEIINSLIKRNNLCESYEAFNYLVKKFDPMAWNDEEKCRYQTKQFYLFVKRFLLIDFPISIDCQLSSLFSHLIHEKIASKTDKYLKMIEQKLKQNLALENQEIAVSYTEKNIYIQRTINIFNYLSHYRTQLINKFSSQTRSNCLYIKLNNYLKLEMKLENSLLMFEHGNNVLQKNILAPVQNMFDWSYDQLTDTLRVFIKIYKEGGLRWNSVSKLLQERGTIIKNAAIKYTKEFLEIRVLRSEIGAHINQFWHEVVQLFNEIRTLEKEDVVLLASVMYQQALTSLRIKKQKPAISTI